MIELEVQVNQLVSDLSKFGDEIQKELQEVQQEAAKMVKRQIEATAPRGHRGSYAKSWRIKKQGKALVVHSFKEAGLTHLLEFGHKTVYMKAKSSGKYVGRVGKRSATAPQSHIKPAESMLKEFIESKLGKVLG